MKLDPILLVEDDLKDIELTTAALEGAQLSNEIVVLRDGEEALDFLYRQVDDQDGGAPNPAMVLLDIKMPKVSGLEVLERIKGDPILAHIPVVMLTSSREEADLAASEKLGANAYMVKPLGFMDLFDTIKGVGMPWAMIAPTPSSPLGSLAAQPRTQVITGRNSRVVPFRK
jgi:CheY-like chemotaxis protein